MKSTCLLVCRRILRYSVILAYIYNYFYIKDNYKIIIREWCATAERSSLTNSFIAHSLCVVYNKSPQLVIILS